MKTPMKYVTVANVHLEKVADNIAKGNYSDFPPSEAYKRLEMAYREVQWLRNRALDAARIVEQATQTSLLGESNGRKRR